jgi:flagellar hook-associated protein 3 FlgL
MRVTQSMLSNNLLRNINTSYSKLSKLQQQIESGSVITRPSDDPVVAVKGMAYRNDLDKINQYDRNIREGNTWLDSSEEALGQVGDTLTRVKELLVQAANDTNTSEERQKICEEISQIKSHIIDIANTKVGENYIFSGTHTDQPLFNGNTINNSVTPAGAERAVSINVFDGISLEVNVSGKVLFANINNFMSTAENLLNTGATGESIGNLLGSGNTGLSGITEEVLKVRANVGARQNRIEMMSNRLSIQNVNVTKQLSQNEDTDYALAITEMTTAQSIHQASLSVGANIIQQTLVDFIR